MTKRSTVRMLWCVVATLAVAGCGGDEAGNTESRPGGTHDAQSENAPPADGAGRTLASDSSPEGAAQQFSQLLAAGDAHIACGTIGAQLRALFDSYGGCPEVLADIAADEGNHFRDEACVNDPRNYRVLGDPADTPDSVRVDLECPESDGYTWVRVDRDGDIWRVTDINENDN